MSLSFRGVANVGCLRSQQRKAYALDLILHNRDELAQPLLDPLRFGVPWLVEWVPRIPIVAPITVLVGHHVSPPSLVRHERVQEGFIVCACIFYRLQPFLHPIVEGLQCV